MSYPTRSVSVATSLSFTSVSYVLFMCLEDEANAV